MLHVELNYATLRIEEAEVLIVGPTDVLCQVVVKRNVDFFKKDLMDCILDVLLIFALNSDLALVTVERGRLLDRDKYVELVGNSLHVGALLAKNQSNQAGIDHYISDYSMMMLSLGSLRLLGAHI